MFDYSAGAYAYSIYDLAQPKGMSDKDYAIWRLTSNLDRNIKKDSKLIGAGERAKDGVFFPQYRFDRELFVQKV
ncbi:hypothetical protein B9T26_09210 [Acinetobacter sp. ANC 4169]|uniref:Uncharacterized protein n=1 Tax=Acinetobacter bouvetii TaxID=202951 RepID=A0A811GBM6_9GAMM|nr:hypothetical protein B9T26_09210 [Acinetobacter sp. ANC 4169]CAB1215068.1 hypothetical protein SFB21_1668 [Acinetobacter bouvetii]